MHFFCISLVYYQSAVIDVSSCTTRFPSTRVRIPATLGGGNEEHQLTFDSVTDIPCIAQLFFHNHARFQNICVLPIPPGAISLRSVDDSPLKSLRYIHFVLMLGNESGSVEALVLPHLGPNAMLIDNSIMNVFGVKLDWGAERLSFGRRQ